MPKAGIGEFFLSHEMVGGGTPSARQRRITSWFKITGTSTLRPEPLILAGSVDRHEGQQLADRVMVVCAKKINFKIHQLLKVTISNKYFPFTWRNNA